MSENPKVPPIRKKYIDQTGEAPLTKTGKFSVSYSNFLETDCSPHWVPLWSKMEKHNEEKPFKTKEEYNTVLKKYRKETILEEKCSIGGGGKGRRMKDLSEFKHETQEKFE